MARILVADNLAPEGLELLREAGEVVVRTGLPEAELVAAVAGADAIVVRSSTRLTASVIEAAKQCRVIARAGVGVDNIDVAAATRRGILVVNSPAGNILAAAEHAVALLLAAARQVPQADRSTKAGEWDRKRFTGTQLQGKTLGLVGLGKVGTQVARRARALGMTVIACDPYVNRERAAADGVELVELDALLSRSDAVSLHAVATAENQALIGARELALLRPGAILVNTARGSLLDESALVTALQEDRLVAALDVFAEEPTTNRALVESPNVIATPHVGALTHEAQVNVAVDAARQVVDVLGGRPPRWPVNAPALPEEALESLRPLLPLAEALGELGRALLAGPLRSVELRSSQSLRPEHRDYLLAAALATLLQGTADEPVNLVNALLLADERQVVASQDATVDDRGYTSFVELRLMANEVVTVAGALLDRERPRIVNIDGYEMDLPPEGVAFLIWRRAPSRPGFIGRVGTLLGAAGVNISAIQVSHEALREVGLMALALEGEVPADVQDQVQAEEGVLTTRILHFGENA